MERTTERRDFDNRNWDVEAGRVAPLPKRGLAKPQAHVEFDDGGWTLPDGYFDKED